MNFVEPIREINKIEEMKKELQKNGTRDYLIFYLGINSGLRVSDIIKLKVEDVRNTNGTIKSHINIIEEKTEKHKKFKINNELAEELKQFVSNMNMVDYIFQSRNGNNKPLSRFQVYRILNETAKEIGLNEIGTHTLRKTFRLSLLSKDKGHCTSTAIIQSFQSLYHIEIYRD